MEIYLNIAGCIIKVTFSDTVFKKERKDLILFIKKKYKSFLTTKTDPFNFTIKFVESIKPVTFFNRNKKIAYLIYYKKITEKEYITFYFINVFEFQNIIYHILLSYLKNIKNGFMIHASANIINKNEIIVFLGKSGSGKSTICKMLNSYFPAFASDTLIIKKLKNNFFAFQTPFYEKDTWLKKEYRNGFFIRSFFFINKSPHLNKILKIKDLKSSLLYFIKQIISEKKINNYKLNLIKELINKKAFYKLYFSKKSKKTLINLFENFNKYSTQSM